LYFQIRRTEVKPREVATGTPRTRRIRKTTKNMITDSTVIPLP